MHRHTFAVLLTVAALAPSAAMPGERASVTDYSITISGIPLAKASFKTRIDGANFQISGNFATTGIAAAFKKWGGSANVNGQMRGNEFEARRYETSYHIGGAKRGFAVEFSGKNIRSASRTPARDKYPDNWVPVSKNDLLAIADPVTALLRPANASACRGTVPVFDGETRMELTLAPKGRATYHRHDVSADVAVCSVRFKLKSGYRKGHTDLEKVQNYGGFEVWLAKSPIAEVYAPVLVKIPTQYGTLAISATRFGT